MRDQDLATSDTGVPMQSEGLPAASAPHGHWRRTRTVFYWMLTILLIHEMVSGFLWEVLQIEWVRVILLHLGYPLYVGYIMGPLKLVGAAVILAPSFPKLKEWAYAGAFFVYFGAVASHMLVGDGPLRWGMPLLYLLFTVGSWALQPDNSHAVRTLPAAEASPRVWAISVGLFVVIFGLSYFTLPKGPPPGY